MLNMHVLVPLSASYCNHMSDKSLHLFAKLKNLRYLLLEKGVNFTSEGLKSLFVELVTDKDHCTSENHKLRKLILQECTHLNNSTLQFVAGHYPYLRYLYISDCKFVTDSCLEELSTHLHYLTRLSLILIGLKVASCKSILQGALPRLTCLDLSRTELVDDVRLRELKRQRPWLAIKHKSVETEE